MCDELSYQAPIRMQEVLEASLNRRGELDVLELGCGTGLSGEILRPFAEVLVGIDLSDEMINICRATNTYNRLEVAEITEYLELANERGDCHDLIAACDTLIYFGDLKQVVEPASKLLKCGGKLVFTVEKNASHHFQLQGSGRYSHSSEHIVEAASSAGLSVETIEEGFLRYEYGEPITGLIAVLERQE